jgi:glutamate formiminotransferase
MSIVKDKVIECVPNFSEGRRQEVLDEIIKAITTFEGVRLLDQEKDFDHNRAVLTFIGDPDSIKKAAFAAVAKASELIDLEEHTGQHPRIGAADVVPFIPLKNATIEDCIEIAKELGSEIGEKLGIPVYLYESAATRPEFRNLANVRKGQYEGLKESIKTDPARKPDFGPSELHPRAGAVAIGARMPLIAYNVNLDTNDLALAKRIAKTIRERDGGFPNVKALGLEIKERGIVQVSMNLTNYHVTPVHKVFDKIKEEASNAGVEVLESEVIGLIPMNAMVECAKHYLNAKDFDNIQLLEPRIWE